MYEPHYLVNIDFHFDCEFYNTQKTIPRRQGEQWRLLKMRAQT